MQATDPAVEYFCPVHGAGRNAHDTQFCLLLSINEKLDKIVNVLGPLELKRCVYGHLLGCQGRH